MDPDTIFYETILDAIQDAVFLTDLGGRLRYVCTNLSCLFGYSRAEVEQTGHVKALLGDGPSTAVLRAAGGQVVNRELCGQDKAGTRHSILVDTRRTCSKRFASS